MLMMLIFLAAVWMLFGRKTAAVMAIIVAALYAITRHG